MLTTIEGVYSDGRIDLNERPTGLDHARVLVTFLPEISPLAGPKVLYGAWKDKIPETIDIDSSLKEIRGEWIHEWDASTDD